MNKFKIFNELNELTELQKLNELTELQKLNELTELQKLNKSTQLQKSTELQKLNKSTELQKLKINKLISKNSYIDSYIDKNILLLVCGPTASGKGSLPTKVSKYLVINNKFKKGNYISLLIDDLVEINKGYIKDINNYLDNLLRKYSENEFKNIIKNSNKHIDIINTFGYFYKKHRLCTDCNTGMRLYNLRGTNRDKCDNLDNDIQKLSHLSSTTSKENRTLNRESLSCDELNDKYLEKAIKNNNNILLETTGIFFPNWLFKMYKKELINYKVIIAWSILDICELIKRNKLRTLNQFNKWLIEKKERNKINTVPRLPDIRFEIYKKDLTLIIKTLIDFIKENEKNNKLIGDNKIRILIFDNTSQDVDVIYDNEMHTNIKNITNEIYKRYNISRKKCN